MAIMLANPGSDSQIFDEKTLKGRPGLEIDPDATYFES